MHRFATFYPVQGGVIATTEDNQRIDYHCQ